MFKLIDKKIMLKTLLNRTYDTLKVDLNAYIPTIGKARLNWRIKPGMYVKLSIMYGKIVFC